MNNDLFFSSKTDKWETPQWLFDRLNRIFCFELDACADDENHKCERYFTESENGLAKSWGGGAHGAIRLMADKLESGLKKQRKPYLMINRALSCFFQQGQIHVGITTIYPIILERILCF